VKLHRLSFFVVLFLSATHVSVAQSTGVWRELWAGLSTSDVSIGALTNTANNPNWPNNPTASYTKVFDTFETELNFLDGYGQRLRALIVPPVDGNYRFWIASDDNGSLYLSSNESPTNKALIAWVAVWTNQREWTKETNQTSALIPLLGGHRYYIEALMKEGGGGDNLTVRWQLPDGTFEEPIPGTRMIPAISAPQIAVQPTNTVAVESRSVSFRVVVTNQAQIAYQWLRNATNPIPGATNATLVINPVSLTNDGDVYSCYLTNALGTLLSSNATLSVTGDTNPPTLLSAGSSGNVTIRVTFSEGLDPASATNIANYAVTNLNGPLTITAAAFGADTHTISLYTTLMEPNAAYTLTLSGIRDASSNSNLMAPSQITFTNFEFTLGFIRRQLYLNIGNTDIPSLTNSSKFPNQPDQVDYLTSMGWPQVNILDNYGGRMAGYVVPPITGTYTFAIRSDDNSQLVLSTDDQPANAVLLAAETYDGAGFDSHASGPVSLVAGQRYYIEGLMKEGGGGDYFYVAWKTPDNPGNWVVIPGAYLGNYFHLTNSTLSIMQQPVDTTGTELLTATLSVAGTGSSDITTNLAYQWQLNGIDILGANGASFTTPLLHLSDSGSVYRVIVSIPGKTLISSNATLSVVPDVTPPAPVSIQNLGATNLSLIFSEPVAPASATNILNYSFTNGVTVSGAVFGLDTRTIILTVSPLTQGGQYTLFVNGVQDFAATPNAVVANSSLTFTVTEYATQDIGSPSQAGFNVPVSNGLDVTGGGADIGGAVDQFQFSYKPINGDFDIQVRIPLLSLSDVWAKAGLMAREDIRPNSRFAAVFATPSMAGSFFEYRNAAGANSTTVGAFPPNYPETWLRLQRTGNIFTGFASYDAQAWTVLGSISNVFNNTLFIGLAVTSHNTNQSALAQFRDISGVTNGAVARVSNPSEALGPCSRKTGLVISEIMYKPAPRNDLLNLEYLEIYNSNPFYDDLSGYRISGDIDYLFPSNTILKGGAFLVIAAAPGDVQSVYGISNIVGPYTNSLKKSGLIRLLNKEDAILLEINYANTPPWPVAADGTGHSIVLARPSYGEDDARAWAISDLIGGSPGGGEAFRPNRLRNIVINELLAHTDNPLLDYVELYNHSTVPVDVAGCILTDNANSNKFVIPVHTSIPAGGFVSFDENQMGFSLSAGGQTVYLKNPDQSRILDAVTFEAQANGISYGRWPDGANDFYPLAARTPGASNSPVLIRDIVINEIMYNPISGNNDDQYVELYNKGAGPIDLGAWQFTSGIKFTFPSNTVLAADSYLVVAANQTNLLAHYTNLNNGNTLGDFSGNLSHNGERLALAMPDLVIKTNSSGVWTTNTILVVEDEVTYGTGGRWGQWAAGGGSSLELLDPRSNHRLAANWGDSDETGKSSWTNIEATGTNDLGANYESGIVHCQIGILDIGECLVDNIEVRPGTNGPNYVANPTFEIGLTNWALQGDHFRSSLEATGYLSSQSLHLRCSDRVWTGANSAQATLTNTTLASGQQVTLRFKARWLRGWPEVLLRLNGNWFEAAGRLPVPANLGTPGLRNSRAVANAGPAIYEVTHTPSLPAANQPAVVTARFHDVDGVQNPTLNYRIDPSQTFTSVPMVDDGTGDDTLAGDGIYTARIPGQAANTIVAFNIQAGDGLAANTRFPALRTDNSTVPECVVMFGDTVPTSGFGTYHLWLTQTNISLWSSLPDMSNESFDGTFVYGSRVVYNMQARYSGSPYHQSFNSPVGNLCHYKWTFGDDDKFLGATSFNKIHQPGNGPGDDDTVQREQTSFWMVRQLGLPWLYRRYVAVYVNGNRRGTLMEDTQTPDGDVVKEHFPDDADGYLYKLQPWFEFDANGVNFNNNSWCTVVNYTSGGAKRLARYRWNYLCRRTPDSANNYTNVYALVDAANTSTANPTAYVSAMENEIETEQWIRTFAIEHAVGNWDSVGNNNGQNMYGYKPLQGKWSLLIWDYNIVLGSATTPDGPTGDDLFKLDGANTPLAAFVNFPRYKRAYWRAYQEIANGPMVNANVDPVMDAKYAAFAASGINVSDPSAIKNWISQRHTYLLTQMAPVLAPFAVIGPTTFTNTTGRVTLTGTAPLAVATLKVNGIEASWSTLTNWSVLLVISSPTNVFNIQGYDLHGNAVAGSSAAVTVYYTGPLPNPQGTVVLNEIMYHPLVPDASYVELFNTSTNFWFDLSSWRFNGLDYTFPLGSYITNRQYLILAKSRTAFASAYGTVPVFDQFDGILQTNGETLTLIKPGATPAENVVITRVRYEAAAPWPTGPNGTGSSLQLIDATQDNGRVSNWGDAGGWRQASTNANIGAATSLIIYLQGAGDAYLDDISLVPLSGPYAGSNIIQNGTFEIAPLTNTWFVASQMAASAITNSIAHSGSNSLHVVSTAGGSTTINIRQTLPPGITNGPLCTLSYWYWPNLNTNVFVRTLPTAGPNLSASSTGPRPATSTPAASNSIVASLPPYPLLWINEVQADNLTGITDSAGQHDPWLELYNPGTNALSLDNFYLANNYLNLAQWAFPSGLVVNAGEFKVIFADGDINQTTGSEWHTGFRLSSGTGSIALSRLYNGQPQVLDYLNYTSVTPDRSYGSFPDGQPFDRQEFYYVTPGATNKGTSAPLVVWINEWMASNTRTLANTNNQNKYDDWFELYNPGTNTVNLADYYLTDTIGNKFQYHIPAGYTIPAGGYLFVWADGAPGLNSSNSAVLHVNFQLNKGGEAIGLFAADGTQIDYVTFGQQTNDISMGRCPDGGTNIFFLPAPTPRGANNCPPLNTPPVVPPIADSTLYPGQNLSFTVTATDAEAPPQNISYSIENPPLGASIGQTSGLFSWTPTPSQAPSTNTITIRATDDGTPNLTGSQSFHVFVRLPPIATITHPSSGNVSLTFPTVPGKTYRIEYKTNLNDAVWTTLLPQGDNQVAGGASLTIPDAIGANSQRFYRIVAGN